MNRLSLVVLPLCVWYVTHEYVAAVVCRVSEWTLVFPSLPFPPSLPLPLLSFELSLGSGEKRRANPKGGREREREDSSTKSRVEEVAFLFIPTYLPTHTHADLASYSDLASRCSPFSFFFDSRRRPFFSTWWSLRSLLFSSSLRCLIPPSHSHSHSHSHSLPLVRGPPLQLYMR